MKTKYYGVIGNRDHIKIKGEKKPFWQFLDYQPDGWLTSLVYKREDLPEGRPMIFDCGAWSYRDHDVPPVNAHTIIEKYESYAPIGSVLIAPDHMLIDGADITFRRRWNKEQAQIFLDQCPDNYTPMAAIHGMDIDERVEHALELAGVGYKHLAIGGVAARASQKKLVMGWVKNIRDHVPDVCLHVLGLSSPDYMRYWSNIGVQSADGSSHFKQAFTGGTFFTVDGGKLIKHKAVRPGERVTDDMPICDCSACSVLRDNGVDTRSYGSNEHNMGRAAHNMNMLMIAQKEAMKKTIVLVACCGSKLDRPAKTKDIYQSQLFKKSKLWAEQNSDEWFILSAKHGLLHPENMIKPYDKTLNDLSLYERKRWDDSIRSKLRPWKNDRIIVLAGNNYCSWIDEGFDVQRPMAGMGIGQQLAWLKKNTAQEQMVLM